ncbi:MAG: PKD domain-containing protein [Cognaticolwellia sp.]
MTNKLLTTLLLSAVSSTAFSVNLTANSNSHADPGITNEASILYWLEKRGELAANATPADKAAALQQYLGNKSFQPNALPGALGRKMMTEQQTSFARYKILETPDVMSKDQGPVKTQALSEQATHVNVLALLIEFPDLQANRNIYTLDHYRDILFREVDESSPNSDITSARQYYDQESGGTFHFNGQVNDWTNATWLMADNNASYYGGNNANDNDKAVPELIKEAVTKAVASGLDLSRYDLDNDGVIDHVMVFHSSTGEEAGGGSIGPDAIWSHRYVSTEANGSPAIIPGSNIKLYGYTVTPVDAKIGVIAHEFGHDLGYPDEYDTENGHYGSPVGDWSIMASGTWVDGGSHPSGFSPKAKDFLQDKFGGNWINQHTLSLEDITNETINLVSAADHQSGRINQVKILLPNRSTYYTPYTGSHQFYSSEGDNLTSTLSFNVDLPAGSSTLTMKSHWQIEQDWDYVLVKANGVALSGNHTKTNNVQYPDVKNFISGNSIGITDAESAIGWVDLTFDLSPYENKPVEITIEYITDGYVGGYGFVADDIKIINNANDIFYDGGEAQIAVLSGGFTNTGQWVDEGESRNYYAQLRNYVGTDKYLQGERYDAGVLLWYQDDGVSNNQVNSHPGQVFIGVVDNDQNLIRSYNGIANTGSQIHDAALSLFSQSNFNGDSHLSAISTFDDKLDYSSPFQPESGIKLSSLGLAVSVTDQSVTSDNATITLTNNGKDTIQTTRNGKQIQLSLSAEQLNETETITWHLGDGTTLTGKTIDYHYPNNGQYIISVTYTNQSGSAELAKAIIVAEKITGKIIPEFNDKEVTFTAEITGGKGELFYRWNFGDDSAISNRQEANHTYNNFGAYTVTLSVLDETKVIYDLVLDFVLQEQPLTLSTSYTISDLTVNFMSSILGGKGNKTYQWDFGDGNGSTLAAPTHTYSESGTYNVVLTVTDDEGARADTEFSVNVTNIALSTTHTVTDLTVNFVSTATGAQGNMSYMWSFGDGNSSTEQSPVHTYSQSGTYSVTLQVTDEAGTSAQSILTVSVTDLKATITHTAIDLTVSFFSAATGGTGDKTYLWHFGDDNRSTIANPTHTYSTPGTYDVTLTVTDEDGTVVITDLTLQVTNLKAEISHAINDLTVNFAGSTSGGQGEMSYSWDFGDGSTSTSPSPTHTYNTAGNYTINLMVVDENNATAQSSVSITISAPTVIAPPIITTPDDADAPSESGGGIGLLSLLVLLVTSRIKARKNRVLLKL